MLERTTLLDQGTSTLRVSRRKEERAIAREARTGEQMHPRRRVPKFLHALQEMTAERSLPAALAEYLSVAHLPILIKGETSGWNSTGKGSLLIGDHRNGLEYFFLLAALGQVGRNDLKVIGKPYALSVRLAEVLDLHQEGYILPVIPRTLASNRLNIFNRDIWMRLFNANKLSTQKEAKAINATAMQQAASCLAQGSAVGVFPTGGVKSATTSAWYRGVGVIIQLLPEEARERVVIIPFQFEQFTRFQVVRTLWLSSKGWAVKPRPLTLNVGRPITVADFLTSETAGSTDPQVITERLRLRYVQDFPHPTRFSGDALVD